MSLSAKRRWRSSEEIALEFLEEHGYKIIDTHVKIRIESVEVGEVDAIVEDERGNRYAVEIKAGRIDVSGIRQAYVNAQLLGLKPLIIAKGFSDDSAAALAEKLGVKVIQLSDYYLVEAEELETIVKATIRSILEDVLETIFTSKNPSPEDYEFLKIMASTKTIKDLADKLNMDINDVIRRIKRLQNKGVLGKRIKNYQELRFEAQLILIREEVRRIVTRFESILEEMEKIIGVREHSS
jgi:predicted RecB family endonuclease